MANLTVNVRFNGQNYTAVYNSNTGYYEVDIKAPDTGGVYLTEVIYNDPGGISYTDFKSIQILAKEEIKINKN